jgi:hypothetical protein
MYEFNGALEERIDRLLDGRATTVNRRPYLAPVAAAFGLLLAIFILPGCTVDSEMAYRTGERVSFTKQGDGKKGEASIRRTNYMVKLKHKGSLKLNSENKDVETLERGGQFVFAESNGSVKRVYTISADSVGRLNRSFLLNGRQEVIGEEVQAWFSEALQRTVLETGF